MTLASAWFRLRSKKSLALLNGRVEVCRVGRRLPMDFHCLGRGMEEYRDFIRGHLGGLPMDELWPGVKALCDKAGKVVDAAREAKIIGEDLLSPLDRLIESLMFVCAFSRMVGDRS